ncbi:radical SAM protein [Desulfuromonas acetexigens]|uniref:Radical SAM protein n=1 Tax=Trichloromonas acetexigens TaxID=38815 RepID=A0A550JEY1_9BACT|nr:radical SAM protein [Desulfuromonas acetexigens]TRO81745.1 radical SAM protein [Desulfuromonas acetexigens]
MYGYFDYDHPLFRPPSEAHSLIFQITLGCSRNRCTFCGMYKGKPFRVRPVAEIRAETEGIPPAHRPHIQRIFLADGDALIYPQKGLLEILDELNRAFPRLTRIGAYASPASLAGKTGEDLAALRERKLRILYFGLESGDDATLGAIDKGYGGTEMLAFCRKAQAAGMKLSVTAILGLAGAERSREHARATAEWITALSPEYFSLLTLFHRHNDDFLRGITPLSRGGILEEASELLRHLVPRRTILRSNHVSNFLQLAGSYPKDRQTLIDQVEAAIARARRRPEWYDEIPDYREEIY